MNMSIAVIVGERHRYTLHRTGHSSSRFGECDVCGKWCSDVFYQSEERAYVNPIQPDQESWTQHGCHAWFGHESCLLSRRR